ncbi:hypothetical protein IO89_18250 [Epilithonimonas lactis]|uniref:Teneurin-like YD-shell domain-containing protein n=2 Tax=Epilithonimonas lactis TaxID=421072 RepID=A0A085B6I0_9FLAO|nr:hypothetical protein IO89_18250 [Epilithonimonas lactis]
MVSCQSKTPDTESNTSVNLSKMKEKFPNQKTAFEKINNKVDFYEPSGNKRLSIDLQKSLYKVGLTSNIYREHLIKINDQLYFLPKKVDSKQIFSDCDKGTSQGNISRQFEINELGLAIMQQADSPSDNKIKTNEIVYKYNKFGQLLKVLENKKIIAEYIYDAGGYLTEAKIAKNSITYQYNKEGFITIEERHENGIKISLRYQYNSAKQLINKMSENQNHAEEFGYDNTGRLSSIIKYSAEIDKNNPDKLINNFVKKIYNYADERLSEEKIYEYRIVNASVLVNKKWQPLDIDQQRKMAWEKMTDTDEIPTSGIERSYKYNENSIIVSINHFNFSNRVVDGKAKLEKELSNSESIKFSLDLSGKIVKKETTDKKGGTTVENYSY